MCAKPCTLEKNTFNTQKCLEAKHIMADPNTNIKYWYHKCAITEKVAILNKLDFTP